jgi:uncharacterized protein
LIDEIYDTRKTFFIVNEYFKRFDYDYACLVSRYRIPDNNNKIVSGKILNHKKWDCISVGKWIDYGIHTLYFM